MKIKQKFCVLLAMLTLMSYGVMAQNQQDKTPPNKEKPKVVVEPKNDNQNRDKDRDKNEKRDKDGKKPGEEI